MVAAVALAGMVAAGAWWVFRTEGLPEGIPQEEYRRAERLFRRVNRRKPGRNDVLSMVSELAVSEGRLATAAAGFRAIPTNDRRYGLSARLQEAQVDLRLDQARQAERCFREFLSLAHQDPDMPADHVRAARKWLSYIFSVELRQEERRELLAEMHADGSADVFDSKHFFFPNLLLWHSSTGRRRLSEFLNADSEDPVLRMAEGRYLTAEGRLDEALTVLEGLRQERPEDRAVAGALLECLFERNDWEGFTVIAAMLPDDRPDEPWLLTRMRGEFALHGLDWERVVKNFERVLASDPANPWCHMGLARAFGELQRPSKREEEQRRSLILSRIRVSLVTVTEDDSDAALELASKCEQLSWREAAETFRRHAARIQGKTGGVP
jgi:thioredoxin-like negative regulator of GroEL